MSKVLHDDLYDSGLGELALNCDGLTVCTSDVLNGAVGDYAKCSSTSALTGIVTMSGPSFTLSDGDTSGRKVAVSEQADILVTTGGAAEHVALLDTINSKVLAITSCPSETLDAAGFVTVPTFDIEMLDPV